MGIVNVLGGFLGLYNECSICLARLRKPDDTYVLHHKGVGRTHDLNRGVHFMYDMDYEWVWMADDSCVYPDNILLNLLERNVDIVVPFSMNAEFPHLPELYENDCSLIDKYWLCEQEGIVETEYLATYRGMLVRKNVFDAMSKPWFVNGALMPDRLGGDIWFCREALKAGFKINVDFENTIGRIAHFSMWAGKEDGKYTVSLLSPMPWEKQ